MKKKAGRKERSLLNIICEPFSRKSEPKVPHPGHKTDRRRKARRS